MSILVVEDDQITGKILELNLKKHGYQVKRVNNGREALDYIKSNLGIELVVADIMMPELSGIELLKKIKTTPEFEKIPVLMSTSRQDEEIVREAVELGCASYMVKPINAGVLIKKVSNILGNNTNVLQDKYRVMLKTNMDEDAYRTVVTSYYKSVLNVIRQIEVSDKEIINIDFKKLAAGADVLGADYLKKRIEQMGGVPEKSIRRLSKREQKLLLRELKEFCMVFEKEYSAYLSYRENPSDEVAEQVENGRETG